MDLNSPVSNADDLVVLVDALCQNFSANKPAGRSGNPHAREVYLVAVIRSLDGAYRRCMADKEDSINALKAEIAELGDRIDSIEKRPVTSASSSSINWAKVASGSVHKDENAVVLMTSISTEMTKKEERAKNVLLAIPASIITVADGEADFAKKLATHMGIPGSRVKKAKRISKRVRTDLPEILGCDVRNNPVLVVVEMESIEANEILKIVNCWKIIASFDLNESVDQNSTEVTKETVNKALTNSAKSSRPKGPIEVPHDPTINIFTAQSVCLSSNHVESARNMQEITPTANVMSSPVVSPDVSMNRSAFSSFSCSSSASSSSSFLSSCSLQQMSPKDSTSFESSS
ncbi:hypothetical protein BpHYR1_007778 [Brachionus plicatilis]|uniref:Uncharacterized protein n=1 Tax=Brachionus plicatilis TaxID=10195 RepID=A0A3M7SY68_BRAPC|nr:hypothetical protein BpHYR1_007778 [Brachionus plicatilis]